MDEQKLILRILEGDERAFGELLDAYQQRVYRLACRMVGQRDAEDVAQEAFVAVYKSLPSFGNRAKLGTWVYRVAVNTCLMWLRRKRPEMVALEDGFDPTDNRASVEEQALTNLDFGQIEEAIERLDEPHRLVVVMHELHGLTYREVADALDIPVGTVKSRLFHAFKDLRRMLTDVAAEAN